MQLYLLIALGGALGSVSRFYISNLFATTHLGSVFPLGTMAINVTGSLVIGFIWTCTGPDGRWFATPELRTFLMVGFCGGYTTFSSFSLQTLTLAQEGEWLHAGVNIVGSVVLCLVAVWLGHVAGAAVNSAR